MLSADDELVGSLACLDQLRADVVTQRDAVLADITVHYDRAIAEFDRLEARIRKLRRSLG